MKLQPNFSWQTYQGDPEKKEEQFLFRLQQQHILVANSVNATIDDSSEFLTLRKTAFTWTDGQPIWKKTISGVVVGTADTAYPTGLTNINIVTKIEGIAQNVTPLAAGFAISIPYIDPTTLANGLGVYMEGTDLHLVTGNASLAGYVFSVTIYFTQIRN